MPCYDHTLIQTLVLDKSGSLSNHYECNPLGSHYMLRSKKIHLLWGNLQINVSPIRWPNEDMLNQHLVRAYRRVSRDCSNGIDHQAIWAHMKKHPEFLGATEGTRKVQIICKPADGERLAEAWHFLSPIIYTTKFMGEAPYKDLGGYLLMPPPELLGFSPVRGDEYGFFVRESRKVLCVHSLGVR